MIDGFGADGWSELVAVGSETAHRAQTGFLYSYAFVMLIGIAVFITWFMIG